MAKVILKSDQTATDDADILDKDWYGEYQLTCSAAGTAPAKLQIRPPDGTFNNVRYNGEEVELSDVGDTFDLKATRKFEYRLVTATAGVEIWIDKHHPHD